MIITAFYPLYLVSHDYLSATVDTVFFPARFTRQNKEQKIEKCSKFQISKPKMVLKKQINK